MDEQKEEIQDLEERNPTESKGKIKKFLIYLLIGGLIGLVAVPLLACISSIIINGFVEYIFDGLIYLCCFTPHIGIILGVIGGGIGGLISKKNFGAVIGAIIISALFNIYIILFG